MPVLDLVLQPIPNSHNLEVASIHTVDKQKQNGHKKFTLSFEKNCNDSEDLSVIKELTYHIPDITKITCLTLPHSSLAEIPNTFHLLSLKELDISYNNLTKIPQCLITGLSQISTLNLSHNSLKTIKTPPACSTQLSTLNLTSCQLQEFPAWLPSCKNLTTLKINNNNLSDIIWNHSSLQHAEFKSTSLPPASQFFFKNMPFLQHLDLSNESNQTQNNFTQIHDLLVTPKWSSTLQILKINNLQLLELPDAIGLLSDLQELHLESNRLNVLPDDITKLQQLKTLNVTNNLLYCLPYNFNNLVNLEVFMAARNHISTANLENMNKLKLVDLYGNELDVVEAEFGNIEMIDLDSNYVEEPADFCDGYIRKRDALRGVVFGGNFRKIGCIVAESYASSDDTTSESSNSSCSYDVCEGMQNAFIDEDEEWECYDYSKFKGVSHSDNEYEGCSLVYTNVGKSNVVTNDDDLYEDAD